MADNISILNQLKADNPFMSLASPLPWENNNPDLLQLNIAVSTEIEQLIRNKRRQPSVPLSGLIFGTAGAGKTHMLARILRKLRKNAWQVIFVTVRAFTNPKRAMHELLSEILICLTKPHSAERSQLDMLMDEFMNAYREHRREDGFTTDNMPDPKIYLKRDMPGINRAFLKCILLYLSTTDRVIKDEIIEWLREGLDDEDSQRLNLPARDIISMDDAECESSAKTIITSLGSVLAYANVPMVICFDELDSIKNSRELIEAWGDTVAFLMNNIPGILPLCFIKYEIWDDFFRPALNMSIIHRLQAGKMIMNNCTVQQAKQLIHDRIASHFSEGIDEKYNLLMSRIGTLREGLSPRDVIELARRAVCDTSIIDPIKDAYDDEYRKVQTEYRAWLPNTGNLYLALTFWLGAHKECHLQGAWRKYTQIFGTYSNKYFAFIAITPKSASTATAAINEGIKFLQEYPDSFCCYVKDNRSHKESWKVFKRRCEEFIRLGGIVKEIGDETRTKWYALTSLIKQINSGNVNIYDASGTRPAVLADAEDFMRNIELVPGIFTRTENNSSDKNKPVSSPEPHTHSQSYPEELKPALVSIIKSSPMKLTTADKALAILAGKNIIISRNDLLVLVNEDKQTFRVYPAKSGGDVMLGLSGKA